VRLSPLRSIRSDGGLAFLRSFALLAGWVLGGQGAVPALAAQGPSRPEVLSLRFEGNASVPAAALANAILTRESSCRSPILAPFCWVGRDFAIDRSYLTPRTFREDYVRLHYFYMRQGFREVQIDSVVTRVEEDGAELLFRIREGRPHRISTLDILGVDGVGDPSLVAGLPISAGDPLNMLLLDAVRDTLTERLQERGYPHADVLRSLFLPAGRYEAEVEFDVYLGPRARFGPIAIEGNVEVAEQVVRRMLPFQEGTPYRRSLLFDAQRNIYGLEIFRHAAVEQDLTHTPDSIIPLTVLVNEGNARRVRVGGGWNSAECFNAEALWSSRNFMGGARRLALRGRAANLLAPTLSESICSGSGSGVYGDLNWIVSVDFTQPFLFSPRNSFTASVYAERQSLQDVFVRQALGLALGVTRSLGRATPLTLSYRPQLARLDAAEIFFCTSFLVCDPLDIDLLQSSNVLSPVGISLSRDRADRALNPTAGSIFLIDLEHASAWTGSDFSYDRAVAEISTYLGFGRARDLVLALRVRGGLLLPREFSGLTSLDARVDRRIAHPQKRFYAGGSNSVRGYPQNQLGPQVVSVQVEDLVFPVGTAPLPVCSPVSVVTLSCDASSLGEDRFVNRPAGGSRLVEGNIELRFPLVGSLLRGAVFLDYGRVWDRTSELGAGSFAWTPGFGFRYATPIGPLRMDLGYRPAEVSRLPVVTSQLRPFDPARDAPELRVRSATGDVLDWVRLQDLALLRPSVDFRGDSDSFWRRLQFHLSLGQAF